MKDFALVGDNTNKSGRLLPWGRARLPAKWRVGVIYAKPYLINPSLHPPVGRESHISAAFFVLRTPVVTTPTRAKHKGHRINLCDLCVFS
jgi:hypothetical protein